MAYGRKIPNKKHNNNNNNNNKNNNKSGPKKPHPSKKVPHVILVESLPDEPNTYEAQSVPLWKWHSMNTNQYRPHMVSGNDISIPNGKSELLWTKSAANTPKQQVGLDYNLAIRKPTRPPISLNRFGKDENRSPIYLIPLGHPGFVDRMPVWFVKRDKNAVKAERRANAAAAAAAARSHKLDDPIHEGVDLAYDQEAELPSDRNRSLAVSGDAETIINALCSNNNTNQFEALAGESSMTLADDCQHDEINIHDLDAVGGGNPIRLTDILHDIPMYTVRHVNKSRRGAKGAKKSVARDDDSTDSEEDLMHGTERLKAVLVNTGGEGEFEDYQIIMVPESTPSLSIDEISEGWVDVSESVIEA